MSNPTKLALFWGFFGLLIAGAFLTAQQVIAPAGTRPGKSRDPMRAPLWWGEPRAAALAAEQLGPAFECIKSMHAPVLPPGGADWLASHREQGQSVAEYRAAGPVRPDEHRNRLYVIRLGEFDEIQSRMMQDTTAYLGIYFAVPVKELPALPLSVIPESKARIHPQWGDHQILSTYVLDKVLPPKLPSDALALIALTSADLWPGENWNFVFGQASTQNRVGVWSIYRNGDPTESDDAYRDTLRRTIKTAAHETGHMLSLPHCITFRCNMNGANHQAESDRNPLHLCPACLQKICWNTRCNPVTRMQQLNDFYTARGFTSEVKYTGRVLELWQKAEYLQPD